MMSSLDSAKVPSCFSPEGAAAHLPHSGDLGPTTWITQAVPVLHNQHQHLWCPFADF